MLVPVPASGARTVANSRGEEPRWASSAATRSVLVNRPEQQQFPSYERESIPAPVSPADERVSLGAASTNLGNRTVLAATPRVSAAPASVSHNNHRPRAAATPEAWQTASEQLQAAVRQAFQRADRHAIFTAKSEFEAALRMATQWLDAQSGGDAHAQALASAMTAIDEAQDFSLTGNAAITRLTVTEIAASHRTPILHDGRGAGMSSLEALQQYFSFAQGELVTAVGELPAAAEALFGLGKVHAHLAREGNSGAQLHSAQAIACQQAALTVHPAHYQAANELGVLLARVGQWQEAKQALLHSVRTRPQAEAWHNLAVVHRRLGEHDLAACAESERQQLVVTQGAASAPGGVRWVDPAQFARMQPPPEDNRPPMTAAVPPPPAPAPSTAAAPSFPWNLLPTTQRR
jgi:tetratricopeptide (TPR) repeat protein